MQVANGHYVELGVGVMCGRGRKSVQIDGEQPSAHVFSRRPEMSDQLEGPLSVVMEAVGEVADECYAGMLTKAAAARSVRDTREVGAMRGAYQYPRHSYKGSLIASHQVAVRGGGQGDVGAASDLHTDKMDGENGELGNCTVYASTGEVSDLAVFENKNGGRAFRVGVMRPGWICAVFMHSSAQLHGSIWASETTVYPDLRIVAYSMRMVENLLARAAQYEGHAYYESVCAAADDRLRNRLAYGLLDGICH